MGFLCKIYILHIFIKEYNSNLRHAILSVPTHQQGSHDNFVYRLLTGSTQGDAYLNCCRYSSFSFFLFLEMDMNRCFSVHMYMNRRLAAFCSHHQCTGLEMPWGEINSNQDYYTDWSRSYIPLNAVTTAWWKATSLCKLFSSLLQRYLRYSTCTAWQICSRWQSCCSICKNGCRIDFYAFKSHPVQ